MAHGRLWQEMYELLQKSPVIPKSWLYDRVDTSMWPDDLRDLLDSPMAPDYVKMHAKDRLKELTRAD